MSISEILFTGKSIVSQYCQRLTMAFVKKNRAKPSDEENVCLRNKVIVVKSLTVVTGLFILFLNTGCLEIPPKPDESLKVKSIGLWLIKDNESDSLYFKSNFNKPFSLKAFANPNAYSEELHFFWYRDHLLLGESLVIEIDTPFSEIQVPNRLKAVDSKNNALFYDFLVHLNHPPEINSKTTPNDQDTLYASLSSALLFSWSSIDKDANDSLNHYIKIDKTIYFTGKLTSIQQSGFSPGIHSFSVWVIDSFGDADTLKSKAFLVIDTTGTSI